MSLTFAEASFLSNAERILRICWFPFPISVNIRKAINNAKNIPKGTAILNDFDKITYTIKPAAMQKIAVLVPDWNIPHITQTLTIAKNNFSHLILLVIAIMTNVTLDAAALHP